MTARVLLVLAAFTAVLYGCGHSSLEPGQGEQGHVQKAAGGDEKSATSAAPKPKEVGESAEVGPVAVTLNGVRRHSFDDYKRGRKTYQGHYYAVVDLTLENRAQKPFSTYNLDIQLVDDRGYSFETEPLSRQNRPKPPPEGQIMPSSKRSGEIAFDLGTKPKEGPFVLYAALLGQPDVRPAMFKFKLQWEYWHFDY
jgi:hypothetical protein